MHLKAPLVMAFWLACLGILAKNMPKRLAGYCLLNSYKTGNCSVPSQLQAKMHLKSPSVMAFLLVCLGILAYSCQNTSRNITY